LPESIQGDPASINRRLFGGKTADESIRIVSGDLKEENSMVEHHNEGKEDLQVLLGRARACVSEDDRIAAQIFEYLMELDRQRRKELTGRVLRWPAGLALRLR
jgi:hypothetical protein